MISTSGPSLLVLGGVLAMAVAAVSGRSPSAGDELKPGDVAPAFTLPASDGRTYSLADLEGTTVVLAWFPKAFTGG